MDISLDGWNIVAADDAEWMPWLGSAGKARAKVLGAAFETDTGATYIVIFKL